MKINEIINEGTNSITSDVGKALPMTFTFPALATNDPYKQYRFGVAIARAKAVKDADYVDYPAESDWGRNMVVVGYSNTVEEYIDDALKEIGLSPKDKKMISTPRSEESNTVNTQSPVAKSKKNKYGV